MQLCYLLTILSALLQSTNAFAAPPSPVIKDLDSHRQPETAQHQREYGKEYTHLHNDPQQGRANRAAAQGGHHGGPGMNADEKPDASTHEGGHGAHIKDVPEHEQKIEGGQNSAVQQAAKHKNTNVVHNLVDGKPTASDVGTISKAGHDLRAHPRRRSLENILHEKRELIARKAAAKAYAEAFAKASIALNTLQLHSRAAEVYQIEPSYGYVY
ncbi:hypothetical protein MMC17_001787 [Xylographa soralifera]|nr:hypothetical protein [Xylographa soralifera]